MKLQLRFLLRLVLLLKNLDLLLKACSLCVAEVASCTQANNDPPFSALKKMNYLIAIDAH
jgi:hypothetical protein